MTSTSIQSQSNSTEAAPGQFRIHVMDLGNQLPPDIYLFVSPEDTPESIENYLIANGHLSGGTPGRRPQYQMTSGGRTLIRDQPLSVQGVVEGSDVVVDPKAIQG